MLSKPASTPARTSPTPEQLYAGLRTIRIVADAIREAGTIPAGTVYAALAQHGITIAGFESIVRILTGERLVARNGHSLVWIGPAAVEGGVA